MRMNFLLDYEEGTKSLGGYIIPRDDGNYEVVLRFDSTGEHRRIYSTVEEACEYLGESIKNLIDELKKRNYHVENELWKTTKKI